MYRVLLKSGNRSTRIMSFRHRFSLGTDHWRFQPPFCVAGAGRWLSEAKKVRGEVVRGCLRSVPSWGELDGSGRIARQLAVELGFSRVLQWRTGGERDLQRSARAETMAR